MVTSLHTDYLIVGAGAMGMAFADVLLSETDARVLLVDRQGRPGGHWNVSYPFVRLHQPSSFYGVNSRALGGDAIDEVGWNAGLHELASGTEVVTYFDQVMQQQFLPSGRVQYHPMSEYHGDRGFSSLVNGEHFDVDASRVVDASYMHVTVPAMRAPEYSIGEGVVCIAPNGLVDLAGPVGRFVVIGAGKTGMDACLWLLGRGVDPGDITWVMPRDSWIVDRANLQPGSQFADRTLATFASQIEASALANSIDDLFHRLEESGALLRLDSSVRPTMYRCATCTTAEVEQLRRIRDVVRLGRVRSIESGRVRLAEGDMATPADTVYVDCTADGLERREPLPVFEDDRITLQTVRHCQQVFSAAFIGHIEAEYGDPVVKNELTTVVPHPNTDVDWLRASLGNSLNMARWRQEPALFEWLAEARLDGFTRSRSVQADSDVQRDALRRLAEHSAASVTNLRRLISEAEAAAEPDGD